MHTFILVVAWVGAAVLAGLAYWFATQPEPSLWTEEDEAALTDLLMGPRRPSSAPTMTPKDLES